MTEAVKHTPGPWRWQKTRSGSNYENLWSEAEGEFDAVVSADEYAGVAWMGISDANARLIAAAPDLLKVLKRIASAMDFNGTCHPLFDGMQKQMTDAIAKAEGHS